MCAKYFTKEQDGLKRRWHGRVWMNPPYSDLYPWCAKAYEYAEAGGTVIALLPAWTDAPWFHDYVSYGRYGAIVMASSSHQPSQDHDDSKRSPPVRQGWPLGWAARTCCSILSVGKEAGAARSGHKAYQEQPRSEQTLNEVLSAGSSKANLCVSR